MVCCKILFIVGDWVGFDENLIFYLSIEHFLEPYLWLHTIEVETKK